jgi:Conjugative transposon, TraM/Domain of unknown function (DUF4138)
MQNRKFYLVAPIIVLPFIFLVFYSLGGGRGPKRGARADSLGLNTTLPGAWLDPKQALLNKMASYLKADADSARKKEVEQRDPYRKDSVRVVPRVVTAPNAKADELLRQLERLKQSLRQPEPPPTAPMAMPMPSHSWPAVPSRRPVADTPVNDPQLERLNGMLDKVIRIQHPGESRAGGNAADNGQADPVLPADSASNAISAVIPADQTLVTGGTIALRLSEDVLVHGLGIAQGQWVYGVVTINSDRMLVHIHSLRNGRSLYTTDLQVYDLDGLPGIHIPGMLSRDVAKESADEGVNGLNLTTYDPSLGAQAASAGVQAAKSLFSRKVRLVRVSVRAGYQVLLRNTKALGSVHLPSSSKDTVLVSRIGQPPGFVPGGSFLQRCRTEGMELDLQGIYLKDSLLWFALRWENHSPIGFVPGYSRWFVRDRKQFKRTAQQELALEPVSASELLGIPGDSTLNQWTGFPSFALGKDKELVLEVGEKNGGRVVELVITHAALLKAKRE